MIDLDNVAYPIVQISLDLTNIEEALETAALAVKAGVDWLEVGTPLLLGEGLHAVVRLREAFPEHPIVADLKTMDGGYLEAEMMAQAGANIVVVMGQAHEATIRQVVAAGGDYGIKVMGDNLAAQNKVECACWMESLGVDFIIHHVGYDERRMLPELNPMNELEAIVNAVSIPVQAVGGLTIQQAIECPAHGAPLVVIGAPLVIDADEFATASTNIGEILEEITQEIHKVNFSAPWDRR